MILEIIVILIAIFIVFIYNQLVGLRNSVKNAWAGISVQLKRRESLVPNLVKSVKGYAKHEKNLLEEITKIRTAMMNAEKDVKRVAAADNMLSNSLKNFFAVAENYPKLRANQNFLELQEELTNTEDEIASARRIYNSNVRDYNTAIETFPNNLIAKIFGFKKEDFFSATKAEKKNVKMSIEE